MFNNQPAPQKDSLEQDPIVQEMIRKMAEKHMEKLDAPVDFHAMKKPLATVTARNGIFAVQKTPVAAFISCKTRFEEDQMLDHLPEMEEGVVMLVDKIPLKYLEQSLTFYQDVHNQDKTEAATLFFWNHRDIALPTHYPDNPTEEIKGLVQDGKLIIYCPKQKNDSTQTNFTEDTFVNWLRTNTTRYVELHSHHTMNAFWSSTDNSNENATQFYFVWGRIFDEQPDYRFRYVNGKDNKIDISPDIVFDFPKVTAQIEDPLEPGRLIEASVLYPGPFQRVDYPKAWLESQHSTSYVSFSGLSDGFEAFRFLEQDYRARLHDKHSRRHHPFVQYQSFGKDTEQKDDSSEMDWSLQYFFQKELIDSCEWRPLTHVLEELTHVPLMGIASFDLQFEQPDKEPGHLERSVLTSDDAILTECMELLLAFATISNAFEEVNELIDIPHEDYEDTLYGL